MSRMYIKSLTLSSNGLNVDAALANPGIEITGMNVAETEGSTDVSFTTNQKPGFWAQTLVKKSIVVPLSGSAMQGPRAIRVHVDGALAETLRVGS